MSRPVRLAAVVAATALGLSLSACGAATPGVAVRVGEQDISVQRVDELAGSYCAAVEDQLTGNGQVVPHRYFRAGVAGTLAQRVVAEQLAEDYGVAAGASYDEKVGELRQNVAVLDDDAADAVIEIETAPDYVEAIQRAVGEQELGGEGTYDEQVAAGRKVFDAWIADNGVEFDPSLGVSIVDGQISSVDSGLSVPVSDTAEAGAAEQPDEGYARSLPDSQRCG